MIQKINWRKILIGEFTFKRLLISILEIYVVLAFFAYFKTDLLIFFPPPSSYVDDETIIKLKSNDKQISAIYLPNKKAQFTIIYSHGNAEDLGQIKPWLQELNELGFNILGFDYQGYGTSEGKATEINSYSDIEAGYKYLTDEIKIDPKEIILYGRSVGTGVTIELARKHPIAGLILESSFISAYRTMVNIPLLPFDKFNNLQKIKYIKVPVLYIHGVEDQVIPIWHSQQLLQITPQVKSYFWVDGAGHNDLYLKASEEIKQKILEFSREIN